MAAKRKTSRGIARKAVKKTSSRMPKRSSTRTKISSTKMKLGSGKKNTQMRVIKIAAVTSVSKPYTKGQLFTTLAGRTGLQRKDITAIFDELKSIISAHIKKQGPGNFTLPGLIKLTVTHKPATKARKGINPFTGEEMMFKAKPARNVVKARALKQLKEMV